MRLKATTKLFRSYGRAPLGDARSFQHLVILPQIFIFIIYISIGAALHEPLTGSIYKLAIIAYLLVVNTVVQSALRHYSLRLLTFHVFALCLLLVLSALLLGQVASFSVFLPLAIIILLFVFVPLTWQAAISLCVSSSVVLVMFLIADTILQRNLWRDGPLGPLLMCAVYLILIVRGAFRQPTTHGMSDSLPTVDTTRIGSQSLERPGSSDAAFDGQLFRDSSLFFAEELKSELAWRLPLVSLMYTAVICTAVFPYVSPTGRYGAPAGVLFCAQVFLIVCSYRARSTHALYFYPLALSAVGVMWWCFLMRSGAGVGSVADISLCLFILTFGSFPWPLLMSLAFPAFLFAQSVFRVQESAEPLLFVAFLALTAAVALTSAAINKHALLLRAALLFLKRSIESGLSTMPLVRLLGYQLLDLAACDRILLICGTRSTQIISHRQVTYSSVDPVFTRGLEAKVNALTIDEGTLQLTDLGGQFLPALADWFGTPPKRLIFLRARAIIEEREESLIFVLPIRARFKLVGTERIFRSVVCVSTLVRSALSATRSRFLSSDVLLAAQNSVAEREHELGQTVHLVNNIAQDIAIQCEMIERNVTESDDTEALRRVRLVETLARNLSAGVSDIKLQRELLRLGESDRDDQVDVEVLLEELRVYARYREHRRGDIFEIQNFVPTGTAVSIMSREFLETGLRLLLRARAASISQGGRTHIEATQEGDIVKISISDTGVPAPNTTETAASVNDSSEKREAVYYHAVTELAEKSGGYLRVVEALPPYTHRMEISLRVARTTGNLRIENGQWALLVDDNVQVTTFYARVAEALSLKYFSAASVTEAESMIQQHGRPRIVITDIQLGSESGLDLVRTLRKKFGDGIPVIVVSGHTADALADEVSAAGATKYLTKPVGRAKLFAEIRALLSGAE